LLYAARGISKVVIDNHNVEIHYKFPVSGNSNTKRERPEILQAAVGIGAPDPRDTLGVVSAAEEPLGNAGDTGMRNRSNSLA